MYVYIIPNCFSPFHFSRCEVTSRYGRLTCCRNVPDDCRYAFYSSNGCVMNLRTIAVFILVFALAGCATEAGYQRVLNSWMGSSDVSLIQAWGPPQQSYETSGHTFLVYTTNGNAYFPGTQPTYQTTFVGNTAYTNSYGGSPGFNVSYSCSTTFEVVQGQIVNWRYKGNNCVAE